MGAPARKGFRGMRLGRLAIALLVASGAAASAQQPDKTAAPAQLALVLTPRAEGGKVASIDGAITLSGLHVEAGEELVTMGLTVASIPTTRYDGSALSARDDAGPLPLAIKDGEPGPFGVARHWLVTRATQGPIVLSFTALPRAVDEHTRPGPLFDLRAEAGGINGAGLSFLPLPPKGEFELKLHWDMAALPPGSLAVSSYGEGDVALTGPAQRLSSAYYAVGPLKAAPAHAA